MIDGRAHATDWGQILLSPSFPFRLTHMLLASGLTTAFLIAGVSAYRWLRDDRSDEVLATLRLGTYLAAVLIPLQILVGDLHGLNTLKHQPAKVAAMEGIWQTQRGAAALLFAIPDEASRSNKYAIGVPGAASFILTHDVNGEVKGLDDFRGEHPPVAPVFWAFRVMVGMGVLMLLVSWWGTWRLKRHGSPSASLARALLAMTFAGWVATVAGWYVTEIGRQPYLVHGVLRTAQAVGPVPDAMLATSFVMYVALYLALLIAYVSVVFYLARSARHGASDLPLPAALPKATSS
jgi:cytochrome d ubiquinol oxidase subunit I